MPPPAIAVSDLVKIYRGPDGEEIRAVDGISFEVESGEVFGLLGPNGAGKTTTLEILEGLRKPTSGRAEILGVPLDRGGSSDRAQLKSLIGVQLQESSYFEELSLVETLSLLASFYPHAEEPHELLKTVGLQEKARARYGQLSGGQARRFSIAAALVNDPKVLFLDEPTTGLDPQARHNLWELVEEIKTSGGRSILYTTHYMEEAELLCDRIGIVDGGKIVALDTPANLVASLGGSYAASVLVSGVGQEAIGRILDGPVLKSVAGDDSFERSNARTRIEFVSETPQGIFESLGRLRAAGAEIVDLSVRSASLEDVFLELTGKALRD